MPNVQNNKKSTLAQLREKRQKISETFGSRSKDYYAVQKQISRRLAKWKETKQVKPGSNLWKGVLAQKSKKEQRIKREKGTLIAIKAKIKKTDYGKKLKTLFTKYKEQFFKEYGTTDIQEAIKRDQEKHSKNWTLDKFWQRLFKKYWKQANKIKKRIKTVLGEDGVRIDGGGREKPKFCPDCGELLGTNPNCDVCEENQAKDYES